MTTTTTTAVHEHPGPGFIYYARWLGRCKPCKVTVKLESPADQPISPGWYVAHRRSSACPSCDKSLILKMVMGSRSEKECGAACTSAKGPNCDCKCNGANHGCDS